MAGQYLLRIDQGADYDLEITWEDSDGNPVDLTDYSAALQIRPFHGSGVVYLDLTGGAGITLGGAAGTIAISLTAAQTEALNAFAKSVWDIELTAADGTVTRVLQGKVEVSPEVTRVD